MRKITKTVCIALTGCLAAAALAGCGSETKTVLELPHYDGTEYTSELHDVPEYNRELWRSNVNATRIMELADPQVFDNTSRDGYYYIYATNDMTTSRTKDFIEWEFMGTILETPSGWADRWAPEVIYDEETEKYLYFFSATAQSGASCVLYLATSDRPYGPFELVDFSDADSCFGAENVHTYSDNDSPLTKDDFQNAFDKYTYFDPVKFGAVLNQKYGTSISTTHIPTIDPHPFIVPETDEAHGGEKYLYVSLDDPYYSGLDRGILAIRCDNWFKPDYSTAEVVTRVGYSTIEDYNRAKAGEEVKTLWFELAGTALVNEGPEAYYHNGKYYLTLSYCGYGDPGYGVVQAVGDSPLGPFRKLTEAENGVLLSYDAGGNTKASGTGHHSFFEIGDKLYIAYHRHSVYGTTDGGRELALDEIKWLKTEDIDGNEIEVMYVNGPTVTVQPRFDNEAEYKNIAEQGTVKLEKGKFANGSSAEYLNDGLLSMNTVVNQDFVNAHVKETQITQTSTFSITFDELKTVRGFMVYDSKLKEEVFRKIKNIEFIGEENGQEITYYIAELNLDERSNIVISSFDGSVRNTVRGGGVYAEFDAIKVKQIKFTVEVPENQKQVGIAEIAVLGKVK